MSELSDWTPCKLPERQILEGKFCRLEPFDFAKHGEGLFKASSQDDASERFQYLFEEATVDRVIFDAWFLKAEASADPLFFVVVDKRTGIIGGRQTLMRIDAANGVIETGNIFWNANIARTPVTTEAFYLFAKLVFDELCYRRFEWKCNNANEPSKRAALRFGFQAEGVFRQHMIVKGKNRDTAWFSMLDSDWPGIRAAFEAWLDPSNFDGEGHQKKRLEHLRG